MLFALLIAAGAAASTTPVSLSLEGALTRAREASPALLAAGARARAAHDRAGGAGRLPDPMATVQAWNVPASRPLALDEAEMVMAGVEQTLPLPPTLFFRHRSGAARADVAREGSAMEWNDLRRDTTVAWFEYWRSTQELAAHRDHLELSHQVESAAQSQYASGAGRQQDVLRAGLEVSRLHAEVLQAGQRMQSAAAALAALMALESGDVLPPPADVPAGSAPPDLPALEARIGGSRPDVRAARAFERAAKADRSAARLQAWLPEVMLGATWMENRGADPGWMPMASLNLPWIWGARRTERRAAEAEFDAARYERKAIGLQALAGLRDAHARATAAWETARLYREDILPRAERTVQAAQAGYAAGNGSMLELLEAVQGRLDARISVDASRALLGEALADLERAVGEPIVPGGEPSRELKGAP